MPEEKFRFKKFEINQNDLVHKVGTDGVLLGAWVDIKNAKAILDIGTGTGLIAIMLAQRSAGMANITAVEFDSNAIKMSKRNMEESPFSKYIQLTPSRLQEFKSNKLFDLVVCNPPYFLNSLKPPTEHRHRQRHSDDLTFDEILTSITTLLSPSGKLGLVLPVDEGGKFIELARNFGLSLSRLCDVFSKAGKACERCLLEFSYNNTLVQKSKLTILKQDGDWTEEYKALTRDFYLKF
jgi:tRNA1Val (adenine37-N6)-methyltransferase